MFLLADQRSFIESYTNERHVKFGVSLLEDRMFVFLTLGVSVLASSRLLVIDGEHVVI